MRIRKASFQRAKLGAAGRFVGIMEKKMETLGPFKGIYRVIQGVILGFYRDNGKEHGNYYNGAIKSFGLGSGCFV